jgi:hypothetical protein
MFGLRISLGLLNLVSLLCPGVFSTSTNCISGRGRELWGYVAVIQVTPLPPKLSSTGCGDPGG